MSIDVLDISGTAESDASFANHMHIHKLRLDGQGKQIGKAEYHTPQSQQIMDTGSEQLVSVNIQEAMQVRLDRALCRYRVDAGTVSFCVVRVSICIGRGRGLEAARRAGVKCRPS